MSYSSLKMETPFFMLFKRNPDYGCLKVFRCRSFPYLRDYGKNKSQKRHILTFFFLDYSPIHKGYKCLELTTNRVYLSRHTVLNENNFSFDCNDDDHVFQERLDIRTFPNTEAWI